ncbi:glycoside hydrolase family protein [Solirubrum puertoriconensis]|uniref:Glycosyl hydrolase family 43 n=1 Tax=Solirubrum puertoriconensis TaxID=1751427 RepID=A0A9X0HNF9_SOLP1|nr:glycoside hydrolase family protein [Solirubrum puertoriconensis]KUG09150.1 glycosyl hydrolase family 43 [Solirubrum puertoriconensis]
MLTRRTFLAGLALAPFARAWAGVVGDMQPKLLVPKRSLARFSKHLQPVGRALEMEDYYVWCNSPIYGPDGRVHLFFSRWPKSKGMGGWLNSCEIARAVADTPEGPFTYAETVLAPRGPGYWDATTCHNPHIQLVDGKYCLFFMGCANGKTDTKRIGLATADRLEGPWTRPDQPLLLPGEAGAWDDHCTTNPAFVKHPNGQYWLYYKSWNTQEYQTSKHPTIRGNRKYGLAIAERLEGPYVKHPGNPVIDFSRLGDNAENKQFEDAFVWREHKQFNLLARDMGVYNHEVGLYLDSKNGTDWAYPKVAYLPLREYGVQEPPAPKHLKRYGRLERPQLLLCNGKPEYLFCAAQGGKYQTASAFIFRIG